MTEMVLDTNTLPEPLFRLISAAKVKVNETNGIINLIPIDETKRTTPLVPCGSPAYMESKNDCPLLGIAEDCGFTVDEFLARKHEEKVLEGE